MGLTHARPGRRGLPAVARAMRLPVPRRDARLRDADRMTVAIGALAVATTLGTFGAELARVWRRGAAPAPADAAELLHAAEEAVTETVEAAVVGYQQVSTRENAMFNLLASFVASFALSRGVAYLLRRRRTFGPFRNVRLGGRHIHHFVPGIILSFASGSAAILIRDEAAEPKLALAFGAGMGLTLDESALLLELEDVYWRREGLIGVQITLAVTALMGALALGLRFMRRGEGLVLPGEGATES